MREVDLAVLFELLLAIRRNDHLGQVGQVLPSNRRPVEAAQPADLADHRRRVHLEVQVGATARGELLKPSDQLDGRA